jgi:transposase
MSTGDRTILGAISKLGNRYLRALFVQAAWVLLIPVPAEVCERVTRDGGDSFMPPVMQN